MLYAGLDLSRKRLDVHVLRDDGTTALVTAVAPDASALRTLVRRVAAEGGPVRAAIESMNGARFVHDSLEFAGWDVLIADAQRVRGLAPLAAKTDKIDARVLAELTRRALVPEITAADPGGAGRAGAGPVPLALGPPSDGIEEPHLGNPDDVRPPVSDGRSLWRRRPEAARLARVEGRHRIVSASNPATTSDRGGPGTVTQDGYSPFLYCRAVSRRPLGYLYTILETLLLTAIIFVVCETFVARPYCIQQQSMENTLEPDQCVLVDELTPHFGTYSQGDIVVFNPPPGWAQQLGGPRYIKPIIRIGG